MSPTGPPKEGLEGSVFFKHPLEGRGKLEFFEQDYVVHFVPFSEDPWESFLEGSRELIEKGKGFEFFGNNPQEVEYFLEWLKREFTGEIDLRKIEISEDSLKYGTPSFAISFGVQRKGQLRVCEFLWELSRKKLDGYFFLDNKPVDLSISDGWPPEMVLFSKFGKESDLPFEIRRKGKNYFLKVDDKMYEIRNRRGGSFDVEVFPVISKEGKSFLLKGLRVMGRDLVEFLQSMIIEHLSVLRNFEIWGRDWQNRRVSLNGLKIRKFKRGGLREAFIKVEKRISLDGMSPWEPEVKDPAEKLKGELSDVFSKHSHLISSLKMEGEEYSLRYSRILKEVESWEEAVRVSRAAKLKIWELVAKHSINHVIMSFYSFYGIPFAEDSSLKRIWIGEKPDEDLILIAKKRLENCTCEELCTGCCFNPCCIEENRYLDRIIGYVALRGGP